MFYFISDISGTRRNRFLTLDQALEYMKELDDDDISDLSSEDENIRDETDLVIIPPDPGVVTDEECIDDDVLGDKMPIPKDISGEIEIFPLKNHKSERDIKKKEISWKKCSPTYKTLPVDTEPIIKAKKEFIFEKLINLEPVEVFLKIYNENLLQHIVQETVKYAHQKNRLNFSLSVSMLKRFIGFLLYTGYVSLPQEKMYWSMADDVSCPIVREAMSRSTYTSIKQNLHLADNTALDKTDKLGKVRPYLEILNENFMQYGIFSTHLSIDEQMIPYYGKHSCKMFLKGKPVRFGYKVWCLCSCEGYLYNFDIYTGKSMEKSVDLGLGGDIVTSLLKVVEIPSNHIIYFDNFFTSHSLLAELSKMGFYATGTIRDNRIGKCPITQVKKMKKEDRGTFDSAFDTKHGISVVRWNDNSVVTMATNWDKIYPLSMAKRYSRKEKKIHFN